VSRVIDGATPMRAWREYLELDQIEVAERLGIVQSSYAQWEASNNLRIIDKERIAATLGITFAQLDF
jgi:transcriptional regulator with XRE-family HTH domain